MQLAVMQLAALIYTPASPGLPAARVSLINRTEEDRLPLRCEGKTVACMHAGGENPQGERGRHDANLQGFLPTQDPPLSICFLLSPKK